MICGNVPFDGSFPTSRSYTARHWTSQGKISYRRTELIGLVQLRIRSILLPGDLHLPLHVGFLDDLGGTKTKVTFEGKTQTLHELWDTGMLETEKGTARAMAKLLDEGLGTDDQTAWQAGTPTDWANESLSLTIKYVYPLPESHEISEGYVKRAMPILHKRLVQAGVRLAWLLNDALK